MNEVSELCKACNIFNICHEPEKTVAKSCHYFEGEIPKGFIRYRSSTAKFVENHWRGHAGYLDTRNGKKWITWSLLHDLEESP